MNLTESLKAVISECTAGGDEPALAIEHALGELRFALADAKAGRFDAARQLCELYEINPEEAFSSLPERYQPAASDYSFWLWPLAWIYSRALTDLAVKTEETRLALQISLASLLFERAIELMASLPIDQSHEYRNDLAAAWMNRGNALQSQNTAESLREAVSSFDRAIELMASLPIDQSHEYRNDLAAAWMNRGNALQSQNTAESLREAVSSFDRAIELMASLPIDQSHEYRNDLAAAWMNRGNALQSQNTAESLREAVSSYDRAIELRASLPIDQSHVYRNDLARAWVNRGIALQSQNTAESLREAVSSYDRANKLLYAIYLVHLAALEVSLKNASGFIQSAIKLSDRNTKEAATLLDEAMDIADNAMGVARYWESRRVRYHRSWAAEAFAQGVHAYLRARPQFLGEFVLECLDPDTSAGAMPESAAMHETAQLGLIVAIRKLEEGQGDIKTKQWIQELRDASALLSRVQRRYFAGTLEATRLRSAFYEASGEPGKATLCWETHLRLQPHDVDGWIAYGDWKKRRGAWHEAINFYGRALDEFPNGFAASNPPENVENAAALVFRKVADIYFRNSKEFAQFEIQARVVQLERARKAYDEARDKLVEMRGRSSVNAVSELGGAMTEPMKMGLERAIGELTKERDYLNGENIKEHVRCALLVAEQMILSLFRSFTRELERTWGASSSGLRAVLPELQALAVEELHVFREGGVRHSDEELTEILAEAVQRATEHHLGATSIDESAPADLRRVREALGSLFDVLPPDEQRYLVFAERLAGDPGLHLFAAFAYGATLEKELVEHVFLPLKKDWADRADAGGTIEFDTAKGSKEQALGWYLKAGKPPLTLGPMVLSFNKSVFAKTDLHRPVFSEVNRWVRSHFPRHGVLLELPPEASAVQRQKLEQIRDARNKAAHQEQSNNQLTPQELSTARAAMIGVDGFLNLYLVARTGIT